MNKLILCFLWIAPICLVANPIAPEDRIVSFDEVSIPQGKLEFGRDRNALRPYLSEFEIEYRKFLSNDLGQRFAIVTLAKEKAILRNVNVGDIVGVFANGQRLRPIRLEGETHIGSRGSILVHFGKHPFPLVGLETRNE